jgi:superfamily II DNA or RNA helicase
VTEGFENESERFARFMSGQDSALAEPHEGFFARHENLVPTIRERVLGGIASASEMHPDDSAQTEEISRIVKSEMNLYRGALALDRYLYTTEWQYPDEERNPHQVIALHDIAHGLGRGEKEGYDEMATATGKTYVMAKCAEAFHLAGMRVLLLAPYVGVADQIVGDMPGGEKKGLAAFASHIDQDEIGKQYGGSKAGPGKRTVVSTYPSFNGFATSGELGEFDAILADEAHLGLGPITSGNLETFSPHAIKIGFSATPDYGPNKGVRQIWPERFHGLTLPEAVDNGLTAPIQCLVFETGETIVIKDPNYREFTPRELSRLQHLKSRNQRALQFIQDFVADGRQGTIACLPGGRLLHARDIARQASELDVIDKKTGEKRKINVEAIGSHLDDDEQRRLKKDFEAGKIDFLAYIGSLGVGWDSNVASVLLNLRPRVSLVGETQDVGRVIRKKKDGKHSIIVDFVDETVGKRQVTALHVLGEEEVNLGKVHGKAYVGVNAALPPPTHEDPYTYIRGVLRPELMASLRRTEGRLLAELFVPRPGRVYMRDYERLLEKEGLSMDRHIMGILPEALEAIEEFENRFLAEYERPPTLNEMIYDTDLSNAAVSEVAEALRTTRSHAESIVRRTLAARDVEFIGQAALEEIADETQDPNFADPAIAAQKAMLRYDTDEYLNSLEDSRDRFVIALFFGLQDQRPKTYEEIGEHFNITRSRVGQLISKSLASMRVYAHEEDTRWARRERHYKQVYDVLRSGGIGRLQLVERQAYLNAVTPEMEYSRQFDDLRTEFIQKSAGVVGVPASWGMQQEVIPALNEFFKKTGIHTYERRHDVAQKVLARLRADRDRLEATYQHPSQKKKPRYMSGSAHFIENWLNPVLDSLLDEELHK